MELLNYINIINLIILENTILIDSINKYYQNITY